MISKSFLYNKSKELGFQRGKEGNEETGMVRESRQSPWREGWTAEKSEKFLAKGWVPKDFSPRLFDICLYRLFLLL